MIEAGAVKLIINMLESQDDNARCSTEYLLSRTVEHGTISDICMSIELTNSIQRTSGWP